MPERILERIPDCCNVEAQILSHAFQSVCVKISDTRGNKLPYSPCRYGRFQPGTFLKFTTAGWLGAFFVSTCQCISSLMAPTACTRATFKTHAVLLSEESDSLKWHTILPPDGHIHQTDKLGRYVSAFDQVHDLTGEV